MAGFYRNYHNKMDKLPPLSLESSVPIFNNFIADQLKSNEYFCFLVYI